MSRLSHTPQRTCVGCGQRDAPGQMLRFGQDGAGGLAIVVEPISGRTAYLHRTLECRAGLVKRRTVNRSLRTGIAADQKSRFVRDLEAMPESGAQGEELS
ncbi:MAG: YlxR family protein [bacterium]|nr:YlxR family protein [Candidatus Binatota bacterium]